MFESSGWSQEMWMWNLRFGHLNFRYLNQLVSQGMVLGFPSFTILDKICDGYLVGKQLRNTFKANSPMRWLNVLLIMHSDACRTFDDKSLSDNRYSISFVDEYSMKIWIYLNKYTSEMLDIFKNFSFWLKTKAIKELKLWELMVIMNTHQRPLSHFMVIKTSNMKSQIHIHKNIIT